MPGEHLIGRNQRYKARFEPAHEAAGGIYSMALEEHKIAIRPRLERDEDGGRGLCSRHVRRRLLNRGAVGSRHGQQAYKIGSPVAPIMIGRRLGDKG